MFKGIFFSFCNWFIFSKFSICVDSRFFKVFLLIFREYNLMKVFCVILLYGNIWVLFKMCWKKLCNKYFCLFVKIKLKGFWFVWSFWNNWYNVGIECFCKSVFSLGCLFMWWSVLRKFVWFFLLLILIWLIVCFYWYMVIKFLFEKFWK